MRNEHPNGQKPVKIEANRGTPRLSQYPNWLATWILILPFSGVVVARFLTPDPRGLGTHQQLGLPPCSMRMLFDIPCPSCGMTTSWSLFSRGNFVGSIETNTGGFLLASLATLSFAIGLHSLVRRKRPRPGTNKALAFAVITVFGFSVFQWLWRHFLSP